MAGYSAKPLLDKLGIKRGQTVYFKNAPKEYPADLGELPDGVFTAKKLNRPVDFMHCFYTKADHLKDDVINYQMYLEISGILWVSWPKKASGVETDITEQTLRDMLLPINLVDIKVAALDETWSGLKFVWRKH